MRKYRVDLTLEPKVFNTEDFNSLCGDLRFLDFTYQKIQRDNLSTFCNLYKYTIIDLSSIDAYVFQLNRKNYIHILHLIFQTNYVREVRIFCTTHIILSNEEYTQVAEILSISKDIVLSYFKKIDEKYYEANT